MNMNNKDIIELVKKVKSGKVDENNVIDYLKLLKAKKEKIKQVESAGLEGFVLSCVKAYGLFEAHVTNHSDCVAVRFGGKPDSIANAIKAMIKLFGFDRFDFGNIYCVLKDGREYRLNYWKLDDDGHTLRKKVGRYNLEMDIDDIDDIKNSSRSLIFYKFIK